MRVLPRENEDINSEWIHDKARFSYDGLKRQRLDRPYTTLMGDDGAASLTPVTWKQGFEAVAGLLERSASNLYSCCIMPYLRRLLSIYLSIPFSLSAAISTASTNHSPAVTTKARQS